MSFAAAFFNFSVDLSNADRGVYARFRVKVPQHPLESLEHLYARVLAYCHCYREGQLFSGGMFEPKDPTIWQKEITGELLLWVQLGCPDRKKIETTLRSAPEAEHRIYFFDDQQVAEFCHMLRGSKTNWVEPIQFFMLPQELLEQLVPLWRSSPQWGVTFIDNSRMSLGPNSTLAVSRFNFNATTHEGNFDTNLKKGTLSVVSGKLAKRSPEAMTVSTPSTILGVRGTEFVVEAEAAE